MGSGRTAAGTGEVRPSWTDRALLSPLAPAVFTAALATLVAGLLWTTLREDRRKDEEHRALAALTAARGVAARLDVLTAEIAGIARHLGEAAPNHPAWPEEAQRLQRLPDAGDLLALDRDGRVSRRLSPSGVDAPLLPAEGAQPELLAGLQDARGRGTPSVVVLPLRGAEAPGLAVVSALGVEPETGGAALVVPVPALLEAALAERAPAVVAAHDVRLVDADGVELGTTGGDAEEGGVGLVLPVQGPDVPLSVDVRPLGEGHATTTAAVLVTVAVLLAVALLWALWSQRRQLVRRRWAERSQAASEQRYRHIFANAPVGIAQHDADGVCVDANDAMAEILGVSRERLVGLDVLGTVSDGGLGAALREAHAGRRASFEGRYRSALGQRERWLRAALVPFEDARGERGVLALVEDVTAAHESEEVRSRHEQRERQTRHVESLVALAGGVAHDFNNLLAGVLGNAELLADELPPDAPEREFVREIEAAARRAAGLAQQMLVAAGHGRAEAEALDLSAVAARAVAVARPTLPPGVDVRLHLAEGLPAIRGDRDQIRQALVHLLTNAGEALAGRRPGLVEVTTELRECDRMALGCTVVADELPEGRYVAVSVRDDGCGMDAEIRQRIFEPFFTTRFPGRGLGLAAVLGIVRGHEGGVLVESAPGEGSRFTLLFPVGGGPEV